MKGTKKYVALALAMLMLLVLLVGCGVEETGEPEEDTEEENEEMELSEMLGANANILRVKELEPAEKYAQEVRLFSIRYQSDDCEVEGYAAFPAEEGGGPWPGLIFNRGGNGNFSSLSSETICFYAQRGYAAFGSQYRGNCGGTGREEFGGSDINDVIHLIDLALELPCVRTEGVYMVGHSRGGMMTYQACALDSRIRAAGVLAGLADSFMMYDRFHDGEYDMRSVYQKWVGGSPEDCRRSLKSAPPSVGPTKSYRPS